MSVARQFAKSILSMAMPRHLFLVGGKLSSGRDGGRTSGAALTFDDGPHQEFTPRLLDRLAEYGIPATFFVIGERARAHPGIIRRIVAEGHELGNHTYTHGLPEETSTRALIREVRRTRALIEDLSGAPCHMFRPPRGELTAPKLLALWSERQTVVLWNVDLHDTKQATTESVLERCDRYRPGRDDILLMHDDRPHAAAAVPVLARIVTSREVRFVPVSARILGKKERGDVDAGH